MAEIDCATSFTKKKEGKKSLGSPRCGFLMEKSLFALKIIHLSVAVFARG